MTAKPKTFTLGHARQVAAMSRKAVSFQKRQTFTNVCCISLCPILMVAISAYLGTLIPDLIRRGNPPDDYVYCSNLNSMNPINYPYWSNFDNLNTTDKTGIPGAINNVVYHSNWARVKNRKRHCVYWFDTSYPYGTLYSRDPKAPNLGKDSSILAQPLRGWFLNIASQNINLDFTALNEFNRHQQRTWLVLGVDPSVDMRLVGTKEVLPDIPFAAFITGAVATSNNTGILGSMPTKYYLPLSGIDFSKPTDIALTPVPYYNITGTPSGIYDLDDSISNYIRSAVVAISQIPKTALVNRTSTDAEKSAVYKQVDAALAKLPHGALYFRQVNHANLSYGYDFIIGTDGRLLGASNFPTAGIRQLTQQTSLSNSILRNSNPSSLGKAKITQGLRILPQYMSTAIQVAVGGLVGNVLYPFGVSFLLPIFAIALVQEKEMRIMMLMKMNGMKTWAYYLSHYVVFYILYVISTLFFYIAGRVTRLTMFTLTDPRVMAALFFLCSMLNKSRFALVLVFLSVLCSVIISLVMDRLFTDKVAPSVYFIWPPFAFYRALGLINKATLYNYTLPFRIEMVQQGTELYTIFMFLIAEIPIFLGLAAYLQNVFPSEFGVPRPWHFPVTELIKLYKDYRYKRLNGARVTRSEFDLAVAVKIDEKEMQFEDEDVKAERRKVTDPSFNPEEYQLVMKNMRKVYAGRGGNGPKLAVKDVTFAVKKGNTFGLLGPNGAGKTTLISILTGLYPSSSGYSSIAGFNVETSPEEVYKKIGICPQFDIQWDDLTISEHLYFYARLKGISAADETDAVTEALNNVSLYKFKDRLTKGLSGGEKRRLSIAIALLGNPAVVFLDEPTTGLDPEVRRLIWNIVNESRKERTIVLTTHSMEEAEALCQRIGIMAKGTLRCLANPTRLKELYGSGYKLYANCYEEDNETVTKYIESILPQGWRKVDGFTCNVSYEFPSSKGMLAPLFEKIENEKSQYGILDWGLGQTTLEEVFIRLISEADASAEY